MKPYSKACENNREPILEVLKQIFLDLEFILEIGSGTGQHAVCFAENLPHLFWQTSDRVDNHPGIRQWIEDSLAKNVGNPLTLDVLASQWPIAEFDGVFSANTAHIMPWEAVEKMFQGVGGLLPQGGKFALYGPFNRNGEFTSPGNHQFHLSLTQSDPSMGIRDDQAVFQLAMNNDLLCVDDYSMPANNRLLVFSKQDIK